MQQSSMEQTENPDINLYLKNFLNDTSTNGMVRIHMACDETWEMDWDPQPRQGYLEFF